MIQYLCVSLFSIITTLASVFFGYTLAKTWLDKRLNQKPVQSAQKQNVIV